MAAYNEDQGKLLEILSDAIQRDQILRDEHGVGDKFRFIRDRLKAVLHNVEENLKLANSIVEEKQEELTADEVFVYVYLFNAQGVVIDSWQKMLLPAVFYEYSVNRPIYAEKSDIESYLRSKNNKLQHGYLTVAVNKHAIIARDDIQDGLGGKLIKVKEGSLRFERLLSFTHNGHEYSVGENGRLEVRN